MTAETTWDTDERDSGVTPWQAARRRMARHTGLKLGAAIIIGMAMVALLAPVLVPHDPYLQNLPSGSFRRSGTPRGRGSTRWARITSAGTT